MVNACSSAFGRISAQLLVSPKHFSLRWMLSRGKVQPSGVVVPRYVDGSDCKKFGFFCFGAAVKRSC
jgi:hypothetical protein